jgi:hypothetical protein
LTNLKPGCSVALLAKLQTALRLEDSNGGAKLEVLIPVVSVSTVKPLDGGKWAVPRCEMGLAASGMTGTFTSNADEKEKGGDENLDGLKGDDLLPKFSPEEEEVEVQLAPAPRPPATLAWFALQSALGAVPLTPISLTMVNTPNAVPPASEAPEAERPPTAASEVLPPVREAQVSVKSESTEREEWVVGTMAAVSPWLGFGSSLVAVAIPPSEPLAEPNGEPIDHSQDGSSRSERRGISDGGGNNVDYDSGDESEDSDSDCEFEDPAINEQRIGCMSLERPVDPEGGADRFASPAIGVGQAADHIRAGFNGVERIKIRPAKEIDPIKHATGTALASWSAALVLQPLPGPNSGELGKAAACWLDASLSPLAAAIDNIARDQQEARRTARRTARAAVRAEARGSLKSEVGDGAAEELRGKDDKPLGFPSNSSYESQSVSSFVTLSPGAPLTIESVRALPPGSKVVLLEKYTFMPPFVDAGVEGDLRDGKVRFSGSDVVVDFPCRSGACLRPEQLTVCFPFQVPAVERVLLRVDGAGYDGCNGLWAIDSESPVFNGSTLYKKLMPDGKTFYYPGRNCSSSWCLGFTKQNEWSFFNCGSANDCPYCVKGTATELPLEGWAAKECMGVASMPRLSFVVSSKLQAEVRSLRVGEQRVFEASTSKGLTLRRSLDFYDRVDVVFSDGPKLGDLIEGEIVEPEKIEEPKKNSEELSEGASKFTVGSETDLISIMKEIESILKKHNPQNLSKMSSFFAK